MGADLTAAPVAAGDWATWRPSAPYSVGVEEEVILLDPEDGWRAAQRGDEVLPQLVDALAGQVAAETHQAALELSTTPHATVGGAIEELGRLRRRLAGELGRLGLAAAVAGMHPTAHMRDTVVSPSTRYQLIHDTMRELARREPTFALHVHVGVPDPESAVRLVNRLRAHLPVMLALSASSPFWQGRDTGIASNRTVLFQGFPRTGLPRRFASYAHWVGAVDVLVRTGAIPEPTFLWWDARPQPRFGTVEVRVMDAQPRLRDTATLVALVQAVARLELEEGYASRELRLADEVLEENRFLAARDGVRAALVDPVAGRLVPVAEAASALVAAAMPHAQDLGCAEELAGVGSLGAAARMTARFSRSGFDGVLAGLAAQFTAAA